MSLSLRPNRTANDNRARMFLLWDGAIRSQAFIAACQAYRLGAAQGLEAMRLGKGSSLPLLAVTVARRFQQRSTIDHIVKLGSWVKPKAAAVRSQVSQPFHFLEPRLAFLFARQRSIWVFVLFHQRLHGQPLRQFQS
ncbi:hypothetical protein MPLDJ20_120383 [Mesorhizobium plurifarium]|uniref:Uncharacterized protein n=1 Tax=Mesorhizobium plurifarium TaxID=69974 RepID=A0A090EKF0_MESPL|nr:hypothetical protein MPLDJ20_120383 [Mesorhizobium plurifarium]